MSKTYQALQKSEGLMAFDPESSIKGMLDTGWGLPEIPARPLRDITQAVADLLHNKLLTHNFGVQGEWEVRTTLIANRQAWRYRSRVFVHGKEVSKDFPSIEGDRTRQIRLAEQLSCLSRGPWILGDRLLLHLPRLLVFHHGIENCQELTHGGRQRDLLGFARGTQALIKPFEHWVVPDRDQRTHV
jgi:hypothetical protein